MIFGQNVFQIRSAKRSHFLNQCIFLFLPILRFFSTAESNKGKRKIAISATNLFTGLKTEGKEDKKEKITKFL
jgi:hypothetical protein